MVRWLITFSLRFPPVILLLAMALVVAGGVALRNAEWDVFPEFAPPQIVIQTEAPGLSAEEVEELVAIPIESVLNGVSRLTTLRSSSVPGLSVVTAIFEEKTRIIEARQLVSERLVEVRSALPEAVAMPRMMPLTSSTSRLLMVGMTSETATPMQLRTLAEWTFRRRLQAVPGIAHVEIFGGEVKQYQVLVAPERLREYNVSLSEVLAAARSATGFGGAGFIETANQRLPIRQRTRLESPADLAAVPVVIRDGVPLPGQIRMGGRKESHSDVARSAGIPGPGACRDRPYGTQSRPAELQPHAVHRRRKGAVTSRLPARSATTIRPCRGRLSRRAAGRRRSSPRAKPPAAAQRAQPEAPDARPIAPTQRPPAGPSRGPCQIG